VCQLILAIYTHQRLNPYNSDSKILKEINLHKAFNIDKDVTFLFGTTPMKPKSSIEDGGILFTVNVKKIFESLCNIYRFRHT
jgi:hypothetical protein